MRNDNLLELPKAAYDAVWAFDSVHHLEAFDHVFSQVAQSLTPGGLFILFEYVGPDRFQFPKRQRELIEACTRLIPKRYRRLLASQMEGIAIDAAGDPAPTETANASCVPGVPIAGILHKAIRLWEKAIDGELPGAAKQALTRWTARTRGEIPIKACAALPGRHSVIAWDPSEAVRSSELLPALRRHFDLLELKPLGGTILQFLLAGIAGNLRDTEGDHVLRMLFQIEDALMAVGEIDSDFVFAVAAPKLANRSDFLG